uniref:Uncharacterized protein n=1 Tax=Acrobeloides nanus TaxID=290746 RepID=A0A914DIS8_9BILA
MDEEEMNRVNALCLLDLYDSRNKTEVYRYVDFVVEEFDRWIENMPKDIVPALSLFWTMSPKQEPFRKDYFCPKYFKKEPSNQIMKRINRNNFDAFMCPMSPKVFQDCVDIFLRRFLRKRILPGYEYMEGEDHKCFLREIIIKKLLKWTYISMIQTKNPIELQIFIIK